MSTHKIHRADHNLRANSTFELFRKVGRLDDNLGNDLRHGGIASPCGATVERSSSRGYASVFLKLLKERTVDFGIGNAG